MSHRFIISEDIHIFPDIFPQEIVRVRFLFLINREISVSLELGASQCWILLKSLTTGVGIGGRGSLEVSFFRRYISCRIPDIKLEAALFHYPQIMRTFLSFSQIASPF